MTYIKREEDGEWWEAMESRNGLRRELQEYIARIHVEVEKQE